MQMNIGFLQEIKGCEGERTGHCGHERQPSSSEGPGKPLGGSDDQLRPEQGGGAEEEGRQAWGMVDVTNLGWDRAW